MVILDHLVQENADRDEDLSYHASEMWLTLFSGERLFVGIDNIATSFN